MYGEDDVAYLGQECADLLQVLAVDTTNFTVLISVCNNCCKLTLGYLETCGDPENAAGQLLTGCSLLGVECGGPDPPTGGTDPPTGGTDPPTGGTDPPTGGTDPPTGGTDPPTGGTDPPTGGTDPPTGGTDPPTGGTDPPTGGTDPPTGPGGTDPPTGGQVFYSVMTATFVLLIAKFAYLLA